MADFKIAGKNIDWLGKTLNTKELKKLAEQTKYTPESILERAKKQGIAISSGARAYSSPITKPEEKPTPPPNLDLVPFTPYAEDKSMGLSEIGMTREQAADYNYRAGLATLDNDLSQELEKLKITGAERLANISAAASKYGYDADERAKKYVADRQAETGVAVENIRAKKDLDLQNIINAGLENVSKIETAGRSDVARITGEFGVEQEKTRQAGQKDIANIQSRGGIYNSLVGAFSF